MTLDAQVNSLMDAVSTAYPALVTISCWVSMVGAPIVLGLAGLGMACWYSLRRLRRVAGLWACSIFLSSSAVLGIKLALFRMRPDNASFPLADSSFPSGHALMAAAFFTICGYLWIGRINSKTGKTLFVMACVLAPLTIGFSRIALNVHWLTDVFSGWVLGALIATGSILLMKKGHNLLFIPKN